MSHVEHGSLPWASHFLRHHYPILPLQRETTARIDRLPSEHLAAATSLANLLLGLAVVKPRGVFDVFRMVKQQWHESEAANELAYNLGKGKLAVAATFAHHSTDARLLSARFEVDGQFMALEAHDHERATALWRTRPGNHNPRLMGTNKGERDVARIFHRVTATGLDGLAERSLVARLEISELMSVKTTSEGVG